MSRLRLQLNFSLKAWAKLNYLMHKGGTEVGGYGLLSDERHKLDVIEFNLVPQVSTSGSVDFDDEGYEDYVDRMTARSLNPDRFMRVWIHTHPGNSATPSATDETSWNNTFGDMSWAIMFILAKGGNTYCRLKASTEFAYLPFEIPHEIDWTLPYPNEGDKAEWDAEYDLCVKKPEPTVWTPRQQSGGSYTKRANGEWMPGWIKDDEIDQYERDEHYHWVRKDANGHQTQKKTSDIITADNGDSVDYEWEKRVATQEQWLNEDGSWKLCVDACKTLAEYPPSWPPFEAHHNLDKQDWELVHWFCRQENVDVDGTPDDMLWKYFIHRFRYYESRETAIEETNVDTANTPPIVDAP